MTQGRDAAALVRAAAQLAREAGRSVEGYEPAEPVCAGGRCTVLFHAPHGAPGDHFSVEFDEESRRLIAIHPGE